MACNAAEVLRCLTGVSLTPLPNATCCSDPPRWAGAFLSGAKTKAQLAEQLDLQSEADVAVFEPNARPLCPAFYIAVDWRSPRICIVVRGTQTWADSEFTVLCVNTYLCAFELW